MDNLEAMSSADRGTRPADDNQLIQIKSCIYCFKIFLYKIGKTKDGRQRYKCKGCGKRFADNPLKIKGFITEDRKAQKKRYLAKMSEEERQKHREKNRDYLRDYHKKYPRKTIDETPQAREKRLAQRKRYRQTEKYKEKNREYSRKQREKQRVQANQPANNSSTPPPVPLTSDAKI